MNALEIHGLSKAFGGVVAVDDVGFHVASGEMLALIGANRAYEPAALAMIAFAITWACMGLLQLFANRAPGRRRSGRPLFKLARRAAR